MSTSTTPYLKLNDRGVWEIRWFDSRSRRRSTGTADRREAELVLAGFLQGGSHIRTPGATVTVGQCINAYIDEHLKPAKRTGDHVDEFLAPKLRAWFGAIAVDKLSPADWIAYQAARRVGGIMTPDGICGRAAGDAAIGNEGRVLLAALNHAADARLIPRDHIPKITLPADAPPRDRVLTPDELSALFAAAKITQRKDGRLTRCERFVAIAFYAPQRQEAVRTRTWFHVDLAHGMIDFRDAGVAQTNKRRIPCPIADELRPIIERARAERVNEWVLDHPGSVRKTFETACRHAGLSDVTPHVLRHTWATWQARAGVPLWKVAGVLGDTEETVRRHYAHLQPEYLRDAIGTGWTAAPALSAKRG